MKEVNHSRLRYFHEVLAHGTIRGAADALNTVPSVITRQIALLEEELGFPLFERHARGMLPTAGAIHLLDYWKACRAHHERLVEKLDQEKSLESGSVSLAVGEGVIDSLTTQVLAPFSRKHPGISFELNALPMSELLDAILQDKAHIAIAYNPPAEPDLQFVASALAPAKLLVRSQHPLALLAQPLGLRDIVQFPLALMPPTYGLGRLVESLEYAEHMRLEPVLRSNSIAACRQFVRSTDAVSFVGTGLASPGGERDGGLVECDIDHPLCRDAQLRLVVRKGRVLPHAAARMLEEINGGFPMFRGAA
ncbi:hypothetical protein RT97_02295 [Variovorax paradoxus]|uniref:HTH lysR-type domain-containing protein n=1 Tax=Variovorax paradoxus TaxID=34073 RepID=A0A0D0MUJ2_VARPD|nr:LysR family transcriptional regulator [Variovorax paradoxus]KIQ36261.1 hypothetical protein RT97_02295 [Variovorax paradoxus]